MRSQVRAEMRPEKLNAPRQAEPEPRAPVQSASEQLIGVYRRLAKLRKHLLADIIDASGPRAWAHYPASDARDDASGYQWFYHSHSADDRPGGQEHGHVHLFARKAAWLAALDPVAEKRWRARLRIRDSRAPTRHLLCIGFDAKGAPNSLFTVNSWVTGDGMASAAGTLRLIASLRLETGHEALDRLIGALARVCAPQIEALMRERDESLFARAQAGLGVLADQKLEILSELRIDLDQILSQRSEGA